MAKKVIKKLYSLSSRYFLVLTVLIAMIPFFNVRVLRMAGDEKVYITQSIEMSRAGNWFVQTLADEPSYFKGPMHYILIRIGMIFFGNNLIAGLWMNALFALLAAFGMYKLGCKKWDEKNALLLGVATALNIGVFSHALASQMEVTVCAFYAMAVAALGLADEKNPAKNPYKDLPFWLIAGISGWVKSPLYSVLIGASGIFYWLITNQLVSRLRSIHSWLSLGAGMLVGVLGYMPAFILDHDNFVATFLGREQLNKGNNNRHWDYVIKPLFYFTLPWTFIILAALVRTFKVRKVNQPMIKLGLAMSLPTIVFWCLWDYKGQNYNLPTIPALLLFAWAVFDGKFPKMVFSAAGIVGLIFATLAFFVTIHFLPLPHWWSMTWFVFAMAFMLFFSFVFLVSTDVRVLSAGTCALFLSFGCFIAPLGEREMLDARAFLKLNSPNKLYYYNLDPSIWSEWSLLQLTLHRPVYGLHKNDQLAEATKPGNSVIVRNMDQLNYVVRHKNPQSGSPMIYPWRRWLTKGKSPAGKPLWKSAWIARDLSLLEQEFYILKF